MGCGASGVAHNKVVPFQSTQKSKKRTEVMVDQEFDDLMALNVRLTSDSSDFKEDFVAPIRSNSAPPRLGEVEKVENLSPKSWTYDHPDVPAGMRIAAPPNRATQDTHMYKINRFLHKVSKNPEGLQQAIRTKREVDDIINYIEDHGGFDWQQ
eukprot:Skav227595  [mRNA]  locus=scaffold1141:247415:248106:+ [translate_table: standard]